MKASRPALMLVTILSMASIAQAISVVLVTDDAGMRAVVDSDEDALIRGTVSSVKSIPDGGRTPFRAVLPTLPHQPSRESRKLRTVSRMTQSAANHSPAQFP
jgi:hypothetical protein